MRGRWYAAGGVLTVLVVSACSASSGGGGSQADSLRRHLAAHAAVPQGQLAPGLPSKADGALDRLSGSAGVAIGGSGGGRTAQQVSVPLLDTGLKIQIARMTVAVEGASHVAAKADEAATIAEQAGGEVDSDDRTSGPRASATLLLRVPPDALRGTLTSLSQLGAEKSRSLSSTDVTQKVADVNSRVESAQRSIARLRVLFDHAVKIGNIIQLESELNGREADLESLQAQQRALARETSLASITLSLVTATKAVTPPKPKEKKDDNGFLGGLKRGWDGFTGAAAWVAEAVGTLLPFLVLLFLLAVGLRLARPRLRLTRRPGGPTPAPSPAE